MEIRDGIKFEIGGSRYIVKKDILLGFYTVFGYSNNTGDYIIECTEDINEDYFLTTIEKIKITYYPWEEGDLAIVSIYAVKYCVRITSIVRDNMDWCWFDLRTGIREYTNLSNLTPVLTKQDYQLKKDFLENEKNTLLQKCDPNYYKDQMYGNFERTLNKHIEGKKKINWNSEVYNKDWSDQVIHNFSRREDLPIVRKSEESTIFGIKSRAKKVNYKSNPIKLKR